MPNVICIKCKKIFYAKPFWIKRGYGRYCSRICKSEGAKKGRIESCYMCGKESYKQLKQLKNSKSGKFFCSKSCQTRWRNREFIGPKHANWKHGKNVYRSVLKRNNIKMICTLCNCGDKRILAVHHVDQNKLNNLLSNLAWLCHNCHHLVHHDIVEKHRFLERLAKR
jgi:hypothetical protein